MGDPGLVTALSAIIRGAVEPTAAGRILAAAPGQAVAQAAQRTNIPAKFVEILTSILSRGNQSNPNVAAALRRLPGPPVQGSAACPPGAIGDAYYAGQRMGCVFGSALEPKFKRTGQTNLNSSYKGWVLEPRPEPGRFEFVHKSYTGTMGGNIDAAIRRNAPADVAAGLLAIITGAVNQRTAQQTINATTPSLMPNRVADIGRKMTNIVVGAVNARAAVSALPTAQRQQFTALPERQKQAVLRQPWKFPTFSFPLWFRRNGANVTQRQRQAGAAAQVAPRIGILNRILGRRRTPEPNATPGEIKASIFSRIFATKPRPGITNDRRSFWNRFKRLFVPAKSVVNAGRAAERSNATPAQLNQLRKEIEELKKAVKNPGQKVVLVKIINHFYPPAVLSGREPIKSGTADATEKQFQNLFGPGNYSNVNIKNMFAKRKNWSNSDLSGRIEQELADIAELSSNTVRARRLGELLKIVPENFSGRGLVKTAILEEIRKAGKNQEPYTARRRLADLKTDLKLGYANKNLIGALATENKRASNNLRNNEGIGRRRGETNQEYRRRLSNTDRRSYETNNNYERRVSRVRRRQYESPTEYERRAETYSRRRNEPDNNYERRVALQSRRRELEYQEMRRRRVQAGARSNGNNNAAAGNVPPLPANQHNAIRQAGGVGAAMGAVAAVPGGAPEIAKAAEALNETGGNIPQALNIKGASPMAIRAVQRLGGPTRAVNALEGLNTLSQSRTTRRRKAAAAPGRRRRKAAPKGPRVVELQRVIKSVKKSKLISLVAHNITKTNNIHENENRLKKYYQKVVKAAILRTPLANIVKKSKNKVRAKK